jgi:hypothetical protein
MQEAGLSHGIEALANLELLNAAVLLISSLVRGANVA